VVGALLSRGLIAETAADNRAKADAALNRLWRNDEGGRANLLHITDAGLAAIWRQPEDGDSAPTCPVPDHHIDPRRTALFSARSILSEARNGDVTC
jgi:hypothetical protein